MKYLKGIIVIYKLINIKIESDLLLILTKNLIIKINNMKTINFELSKRLTEWWYLDNIETEYCYSSYKWENDFILLEWYKYNTINEDWDEYDMIKTLTISEALDFLPNNIYWCKNLQMGKQEARYTYWDEDDWAIYFYGETLLEAIEKLITHLLDNNLLTK